jgi:hypothetical protein
MKYRGLDRPDPAAVERLLDSEGLSALLVAARAPAGADELAGVEAAAAMFRSGYGARHSRWQATTAIRWLVARIVTIKAAVAVAVVAAVGVTRRSDRRIADVCHRWSLLVGPDLGPGDLRRDRRLIASVRSVRRRSLAARTRLDGLSPSLAARLGACG